MADDNKAHLVRSYSQDGEDRVLMRALKHKRGGFYVDIGAHHPFRFSNTALFYELGWQGINVDATPGSMELFNKHRPRDINLEVAVARNSGMLPFKRFVEPALNTAIVTREFKSTNASAIDIVEVPCLTINGLLEKHLPPNQVIDFISIDVEGLDFDLVDTLDFSRFSPQFMVIEDHGLDLMNMDKSKTFRKMESVGYKLAYRMLFSTIYERIVSYDKLETPKTRRNRVVRAMEQLDECVWPSGDPGELFDRYRRAEEGRRRLRVALSKENVVVAGGGLDEKALANALGVQRATMLDLDAALDGEPCDLMIASSHTFVTKPANIAKLADIRRKSSTFASTVYLRDSHHMFGTNLEIAEVADFVVPGHFYKNYYLKAQNLNVTNPVPMAAGQFPAAFAQKYMAEEGYGARSDALYGGYGYYFRWPFRHDFIEKCGSEIPNSKVRHWKPNDKPTYFDLKREEQFRDWMAHKVSLVVNTDFCIPQRIFDALLTGQIPIVPLGLIGMELCISEEMQKSLPIIFYGSATIESVKEAYARALSAFDAGGAEGVERRHSYAIQNHMMWGSWAKISRELRRIADTGV